jgi:hypothetical protein
VAAVSKGRTPSQANRAARFIELLGVTGDYL